MRESVCFSRSLVLCMRICESVILKGSLLLAVFRDVLGNVASGTPWHTYARARQYAHTTPTTQTDKDLDHAILSRLYVRV